MRAAQLINNKVNNFVLVDKFTQDCIDPLNSEIGDIWTGVSFTKPTIQKTREELKAERAELVDKIKVEVDGILLDGDEESQNRMARAIIAMKFSNTETTTWVDYNNQPVTVTVDQLSEALVLSGKAQTAIWII